MKPKSIPKEAIWLSQAEEKPININNDEKGGGRSQALSNEHVYSIWGRGVDEGPEESASTLHTLIQGEQLENAIDLFHSHLLLNFPWLQRMAWIVWVNFPSSTLGTKDNDKLLTLKKWREPVYA